MLLLRAKDGEPLAELPYSDLAYGLVLTGTGSCSLSLPKGSAQAARDLIGPGLGRELAVIRNDGACVWNGPLIATQRTLETVTLTAADPGWYFLKRVTEQARNYGRPVLDAVADLVAMAQSATPNTPKPKAFATLYRLTAQASGGPVKRWAINSTDRLPILDVIGDLADDEAAGFDWRWSFGYQRNGMLVSRTWAFAFPTIGTDHGNKIVVEPPHLLEYEEVEDMARAANRVHVLGAGSGTGRRRAFANNGTHGNIAGVLYEVAVERSNVTNQATLQGMANAFRRTLNPPTRTITTTHQPTATGALTYDAIQVGDTVRVRASDVDLRRRVVAMSVAVSNDGAERVTLTYNDPTDEVTS